MEMSDEKPTLTEAEIMERVIQHFRDTPVTYWEARIKQYMWEAANPSPNQIPSGSGGPELEQARLSAKSDASTARPRRTRRASKKQRQPL